MTHAATLGEAADIAAFAQHKIDRQPEPGAAPGAREPAHLATLGMGNYRVHHVPCGSSALCIASRASLSWQRARLIRLRTVPIEMFKISAIAS